MPKIEKQIFTTSFYIYIILFSIAIVIICFFPYWFTRPSFLKDTDFTEKGQIGDVIGGTMSPFIGIAAALLTFIAFWVQYKANLQQTLQFENQANDVTVERFENKFYELLRIQRENLNEIEIADIKGRKVFIFMFYEFRFCYAHIKKFIETYNKNELGFTVDDEDVIVDIAYHIFFMGIGDNSDKLVIASLIGKCDQDFLISLISYLKINVKDEWKKNTAAKFEIELKNHNKLIYNSKYMPLGGHISRLGHYFRHLYQTVKFISEQNEELFSEEKKCEYAKTLRAQLSDYEQLILFYNINSTLGNAWVNPKHNFIRRFRMIKNMPVPLADFGIIPKIKFKNDISHWNKKNKSFFEWDERH